MPTLVDLRTDPTFPKFTWIAQYENGEELHEYEQDGTQHLLREINESRLFKFIIENASREERYWVNVKTGEFNLNGMTVWSKTLPKIFKEDGTSAIDFRLIWFKRIKKEFVPDDIQTTIQYVFGLQATYEEKNCQQLIWVQDDSSVHINGEQYAQETDNSSK